MLGDGSDEAWRFADEHLAGAANALKKVKARIVTLDTVGDTYVFPVMPRQTAVQLVEWSERAGLSAKIIEPQKDSLAARLFGKRG
ncbi:MAG: hypothetical protein ACRBCL_01305 [Maritimibacter sp.]